MKKSHLSLGMALLCIAGIGMSVFPASESGLFAQNTKNKRRSDSKRSKAKNTINRKPVNSKLLDVQVKRAEDQFIRETLNVAKQYEDAGHLEKASQVYKSVLKVRSDLPKIKAHIDGLEETLLSANEHEFEVDVSQGWGKPRARVFKGREIRLKADGDYRFITSQQIGPEGFPTEKPELGNMSAGIACGALMGMIVAKDKSGKPKPGKPFKIGAGCEHAPTTDGLLFIRVNLPTGHKSNGKISITMSGYVRA